MASPMPYLRSQSQRADLSIGSGVRHCVLETRVGAYTPVLQFIHGRLKHCGTCISRVQIADRYMLATSIEEEGLCTEW